MKKILVPLTGRPLDRRAVAAAFLVAERFGAQVEGLSVMPQVEIRTSIESTAIPKALVDQLIRIGQAEQAEVIDAAHRLFDEFGARHAARVAASWQQATGPLAETVAEEGRLADLTVIAQASDGTNAMGPVIEAALFGSGRPLLLAPRAEPASIGGTVAVAWDGGSAAARAVAAAIPFLHRAGKVVLLSTDGSHGSRAADPDRLTAYLGLHGIVAAVQRIAVGGQGVGKALLDGAQGLGCDLLVMGGYGHSRVRERVWGGVTLDILREPPTLPILMAH
ncbi:universal stress protein [Azospirillum picis]|uniref:Nucleotide-binding universal stress UspA family protein n=1 Tax=Azospirillum picis TaxID=488438 RepID=A0ABU0MCP9_9PROT|nr:universal stress protein [Azospirillum picis]MBP2297767.1 nucleotide-binding universal stress UspA family protein [Azospirillum picis]MDQ0531210.1 nucleotide-binding universal stress UspA family protein [Azospirillum picis]